MRKPHPVIAPLLGLGSLGVAQVLDTTTTNTIAATIQQVEGYYPGTLAYQNNNPGNLIFVGQAGATKGAGGFAKFATYDDGKQALDDQIQLYAARGMSIQDMMNVYAPASDGNNPTAYAAQIASALGVSPSTNLLLLSMGIPETPPPPDVLSEAVPAGLLDSFSPGTLMLGGLGLLVLASWVSDE